MITIIALILAIVGSLNWLTIGIFGFNFITWILGAGMVAGIIYILAGLAGIWLIFYLIKFWNRLTRNV